MRLSVLFACALTAVLGAQPAAADDDDDDDDHERAREALERGAILPLARILDIARAETGGRVIEVEFDEDDGRYIYEVELVTPDGRRVKLEIDAATGAILKIEDESD